MKKHNITSLQIYPEHRESKLPTTNCIMEAFSGISRYKIIQADEVLEEYRDQLSDVQLNVLKLIGMRPSGFWNFEKK